MNNKMKRNRVLRTLNLILYVVLMLIFFSTLVLAFSDAQASEIYKCVDTKGNVLYTDKGCGTDANDSDKSIKYTSVPISDNLSIIHESGLRPLEVQQIIELDYWYNVRELVREIKR